MTTYRRIESVGKAMGILRFLAEQKTPVPAAEIARTVELPTGTLMCHLVTLEDDRMVRRIGDHWEIGDGLAIFWARRKAQLEGGIHRMKNQLKDMGVETDG